ncbi:hypothetical protein JQ634_08975 [Bradyrhizobium sp. AUGA SZCCT0240]|jgi:hypothetical protein|uniref:hypothetical protein n=1 Tax=unclassified Bradyrhizobium TaxID=2631580 RepID=UPI001BA8484D|nr:MULTISPECIES: hypothetical protein [unclassified Bradyrhizobium]MBR1191877.1 hypothetical protein [Bradyrhizobium sp. AUGA SZCCT0160]MBR1198354.1 hypothetical protein [Bradyrhizobium sp. AUGA SZCCT0158]MBR1243036.1 hypothetical protein [Bradyrhizobium sp. AUGA SZCCT0274]MBR1245521.1 hypothetical protein [Bradyrhizobium sp. AUGA SZCCT0169]MBR1253832.1 hypothetical protein [Bradyrhizobium sp. AUGA SZCCT0240]
MANKPPKRTSEFGTRKPSVPPVPQSSGPPAKRSGHVALFLMGTLAVGSVAYTLMPRNKCEPSPNTPQPSLLQNSAAECQQRGSSSSSSGGSGGGWSSSSRSSYYGSDSSTSHSSSSSSGISDSGSHSAQRGGFGSFGHAVGFSGG